MHPARFSSSVYHVCHISCGYTHLLPLWVRGRPFIFWGGVGDFWWSRNFFSSNLLCRIFFFDFLVHFFCYIWVAFNFFHPKSACSKFLFRNPDGFRFPVRFNLPVTLQIITRGHCFNCHCFFRGFLFWGNSILFLWMWASHFKLFCFVSLRNPIWSNHAEYWLKFKRLIERKKAVTRPWNVIT